MNRTLKKEEEIRKVQEFSSTPLPRAATNAVLERRGESLSEKPLTLAELARRPAVTADDLREFLPFECSDEALAAAAVELKYEGYLKKQEHAVREQRRLEERALPQDMDYLSISALRLEARQKLDKIRPLNLGQASRISGVSPADIAVLIVALAKSEPCAREKAGTRVKAAQPVTGKRRKAQSNGTKQHKSGEAAKGGTETPIHKHANGKSRPSRAAF